VCQLVRLSRTKIHHSNPDQRFAPLQRRVPGSHSSSWKVKCTDFGEMAVYRKEWKPTLSDKLIPWQVVGMQGFVALSDPSPMV